MIARVLLDVGGLKVSKPGVSVLTAARKDLTFFSDSASFPIVETIQYNLSPAWSTQQAAYFQNSYPDRPMCSVFWAGGIDPATLGLASQRFFALMSFSKVACYSVVTHRSATTSNYTTTRVRIFTDRITFESIKSNQGGSDMVAFSGFLSIIVHGFYG